MSYILDALRKADAQRERDPARGIHAQPTPLAGESVMQGAPSTHWLWIAGFAGVAVVGGAVWYLGEHKSAVPAPAATATATATPSVTPTPPRPPVMLPAPAAPLVQPPPPAARTAPPRDPTNSSRPPMRGMPQVNLAPPNAPGPASPAMARAAAAEAAAASAAGVPPRPAISAPAQTAQVPAAVQAATGLPPEAPKLTISGGVYSPSAAQRMLIVNGQVFNEGSEVAPGVTVEEIKPRTAVLKFRGTRYTVAY